MRAWYTCAVSGTQYAFEGEAPKDCLFGPTFISPEALAKLKPDELTQLKASTRIIEELKSR